MARELLLLLMMMMVMMVIEHSLELELVFVEEIVVVEMIRFIGFVDHLLMKVVMVMKMVRISNVHSMHRV